MKEPSNMERAMRVQSFLRQYVNETDGDCPIEEYHVSDAIADCLHWLAQTPSALTSGDLTGMPDWVERVLWRARNHFEAEQAEEKEANKVES